MGKVNVAVVGCGRISKMYQKVFSELCDNVAPILAVDTVLARAQEFASNFLSCRASSSLVDLLGEQVEVVHILTPHHLHKQHVLFCLESGFDVLLEKPIAITVEDGIAMSERAKQLGRNFGVIFQNRYIEGVQELRRLYKEGLLGKPLGIWSHLAWFRPASYYACPWKGAWATEGGGVVIDQAIHSLDLVRYVLDLPVKSIQASIDTRILTNIEVEDVADAAIEFEGGIIYSFFACNYNTHNAPIRIEFNFERGRALLTETEMHIAIDGQKPYTVLPPCGINVEGNGYWGSYHLHQIRDFYHLRSQGKQVPWSGFDATETQKLVAGIYQSAKEKRKICW